MERGTLLVLLGCLAACGGRQYEVLSARTGLEVGDEAFDLELQRARAVCVGETHDDSDHHYAQLEVLRRMRPAQGPFAVGFEMFQRPFQSALDTYSRGESSDSELLRSTEWHERWGYDWSYYAPLAHLAVDSGGSLVALNISKELREAWKEREQVPLSPEQEAAIPELNLGDEAHRRWFRSLMQGMGSHDAVNREEDGDAQDVLDRIYPVQVLWDETMADTAAQWLSESPDRRMLIIAGNGHCHDSAIVNRIVRRGIEPVLSVRPVEDADGQVKALLKQPINDYLIVLPR